MANYPSNLGTVKIAHWVSRGARWEAILERDRYGYTLHELKHGRFCGGAARSFDLFISDQQAIDYFQTTMADRFDAAMRRVA